MTDVAIVGIGCRFPGSVHGPDEFWDFLCTKGDGIVEVPADRWSLDRYYDPDPEAPGRMYTRHGGFLRDAPWDFDAEFFGISPREAALMDPQQRLLLEVAVEALDDAGMAGRVGGRSVGVYVGGFTNDNQIGRHVGGARVSIDSHTATSSTFTMLSNRVSYVLDLTGPSMTIDTACSSSLVAVHQAATAIGRGECESALAGGVNFMLQPETFVSMCKGRFLAPDGRCKSFDASADGYARGEGAGFVVLKPLAAAQADGDRVYAVIRASGVNQDGRTSGITVPNPVSQEALARQVLLASGLEGSDIGYVEAHGTGTSIGDPLEAQALGAAFGTHPQRHSPLIVGSVKAAIGHLEAAAGVAGLIKAALVVHHRTIVPQAWLEELNPAIPFDALNLRVPTELEPFPAGYAAVNVAVNGFGYGGTNAHVILSEAPERMAAPVGTVAARPQPLRLLPVSGRTEPAARAAASRLADVVEVTGDLETVCDAAWGRRAHHPFRAAFHFDGAEDLAAQLRSFAAGEGRSGTRTVGRPGERPVFVFSGMGPQWWRMGRDLLEAGGAFAEAGREIDECFIGIAGWSIIDELRRDEADSRIASTAVAQPANFLVQVAFVAELTAIGIEPSVILGHSVGEVSAAYVSGALSLEDALLVSYHRARLQATTAGTGGMLAVGLPLADILPWLPADGSVSVAAVNSPSSVTLAGGGETFRLLPDRLGDAGIVARPLRVEVPYHSSLMDPILEEVASVLEPVTPRVPALPLYSSVTAGPVTEASWDASYWVDNVRQPVRFADAVAAIVADGHHVFLEIGPHPVLGGNIREILVRTNTTGAVIPTLIRGRDDRAGFERAAGELYSAGCLDPTHRPGSGRRSAHVDLPSYPWQRTRLWTEDPQLALERRGDPEGRPMLGLRTSATATEWEVELGSASLPWLSDHIVDGVVVLPGAAYLDAALSAAAELTTKSTQVLQSVTFVAPLIIDEHDIPVVRIHVEDTTSRFAIYSRPARGQTWTLHAKGQIVDAPFQPQDRPVEVASTAVRIDATSMYAALAGRGLRYGPAFRRITEAWIDSTGIVGHVDAAGVVGSRHLVHPTVTDAALQCVAALFESDGQQSTGPIVPASVRSVRRYGPLPADVTVTARRLPGRGLWADVTLLGRDGTVALELIGVEFRPVSPPTSVTSRLEGWWLEPQWELRDARSPDLAPALMADELAVVVALGVAPGPRALTIAAARPRSVLVTLTGGLDGPSGELAAALTVALDDPATHRISVIVVPGPAELPGIDVVGGLVVAARTVKLCLDEAKLSAVVSGDAAPASSVPPVQAVVVTEQALSLPGDPPANLGHAGLVGARRTLLNEQPEVRWRLVDVDAGTAPQELDLELLATGVFGDDDADEVALRDGIRFVMQMIKTLPERLGLLERATPMADPDQSFCVEAPTTSLLADLALRAVDRVEPGPDQVEVRVISAGVNYKDALKVVGLLTDKQLHGTYFGTALGMECLAVVVRVGPGVTRFEVGERLVIGVRNSMARYLTVDLDEGVVVRAPSTWSDVGCASNLPFLTARYALVDRAQLAAGETVLIHGAAGGVGLAAIQVAKRLGATVVGTASTPERRAQLLAAGADHALDSRSLNFVDEVRALTGGRGADVIVSSAPGEILKANLEVAAEFGRIVEVGKADIYGGGVIDLGPFDRNLSFMAIDIDRMLAHNRPKLLALVERVVAGFESGEYVELPTTAYPLSQLKEAYGAVARSSHVGRVAITFADEAPEVRPALPVCRIRSDGSYLITGGFGGFGLATARWLVDRGARHLVLVGRRGATNDAAKAQILAFREGGVEVVEAVADVADAAAVAELVAAIGAAPLPLRGIFHAAGVLDDQPYTRLTSASLRTVLGPKAVGAWNLHQAVSGAGIVLDHFVLYSSVTSVVGTIPQLSYAAANATLDALAQHRQALGLAGLSVSWGSLSGGGMAESSEEVERYLAMLGLRPIDMDVAAQAIGDCVRFGGPHVGVVDLDWGRWAATHPASAGSPRVAAQVAAAVGETDTAALRTELLKLPEEQRVDVVAYMLAEQVAIVLGIPADVIDLATPLPDLGLDSLMAVELGARINLTFGVEFSALELIRGVGLAGIAARLLPAIAGDAAEAPGPDRPSPVPAAALSATDPSLTRVALEVS